MVLMLLYGAKSVVAFDISDRAVACARKNAQSNGVNERIDVRRGTLWESLSSDKTFDLIIANPPLLPDTPTNTFETALFDAGLQATTDFIASLPTHLARRGRCYLLTSDVIDRKGSTVDIFGQCSQLGLKLATIAERHLAYETYQVHRIEKKHFPGRLQRPKRT